MVVTLTPGADRETADKLSDFLSSYGVKVNMNHGEDNDVLVLVGDTHKIDIDLIESFDIVASAVRISDPCVLSGRKNHKDDTIIDVGGVKMGGGNFVTIAGPCTVESEEQIIGIAKQVKAAGADILRGGAYKPRTSPYTFCGLRKEGIEMLVCAKRETGMPIISEIMDISHLDVFEDVDIIQVGARNMQNFELLHELGKQKKPVLLKRGLSSTLSELLMSAEHIMAEGNPNVILCERGIRTFENATRNTFDISAIPMLRSLSHLPVIADPSHACGISDLVIPLSLASVAAGAGGIMVEVHSDPECALCDGNQALLPSHFKTLVSKISKIRKAIE